MAQEEKEKIDVCSSSLLKVMSQKTKVPTFFCSCLQGDALGFLHTLPCENPTNPAGVFFFFIATCTKHSKSPCLLKHNFVKLTNAPPGIHDPQVFNYFEPHYPPPSLPSVLQSYVLERSLRKLKINLFFTLFVERMQSQFLVMNNPSS